jgi:spermidine synthase
VAAPTPWRVKLVLIVFGFSGLGALVLEVAWTRVLALVMGSSVYAFALMLLAFLIGLATGGAFFSRWLRRRPRTDPYQLLAILLGAAGLLAYATTFLFTLLPRLFGEIYFLWNPSADALLVVQLGFGLLIMFPATFALGGIFPAVLQIHARSLAQVAGSVGVVYASNTVGTIAGAALAGFLLIPRLGVQPTVLLVAAIEVLLGLVVALALVRTPSGARTALVAALGVGLLLPLFVRPTWDAKLMNSGVYMNLYGLEVEGWEAFESWTHDNNVVVYAEEGLTASVFVADQPEFGNRYLSVNGKIEASTNADLETQLMASHLPLLLHRDPRDVMVIGLASGITVGAAAAHTVETIRVVEVEEKMVPAARLFEDHNNHVLDDERVRLSINDARNELEFSSQTYDVIISEPSNPWMTVAANLFTEEFFAMARTRVRPDGLFCQWIQNYYLPADDLRSIVRAFHKSFPYVMLFETFDGVDILLLGSMEPLGFDLAHVGTRLEELSVRMDLARVDVRRAEDLLTLFRLGPRDVERLIEGAPRNTDDNARVEFSAPKTLGVYTLDDNLAMLRAYTSDPLDYVAPEIRDPLARDEMGLDLAESLLGRGYLELASETVARVGDPSLDERKARLVQSIQSNAANQ